MPHSLSEEALRVARLAQAAAAGHPDAAASDPALLGWMAGSPPPAQRLVRFADGSKGRFPQTRWAFSNQRQLLPTRRVWRGPAPPSLLPRAERGDLDGVSFTPFGSDRPMTWAESLAANWTDGIVVLHRGRIVQERYFGALQAHVPHLAMSVTKSLVGTLAATLLAEGTLHADATVAHHVPELRASGFGSATLRQLLDMRTALRHVEDYSDPNGSFSTFVRAAGVVPRGSGQAGPQSIRDFLPTVGSDGAHGGAFAYRTVNTDVLAWVIHRATGLSVGDCLQERLWTALGMEEDAYFSVDANGTEFAGGGLNACLRDLARFGEAMRQDGVFNGRQVVPAAVVADLRNGGERGCCQQAGFALLQGWSYRSMWWLTHNAHGAFAARGIHGQAVYIDPAAEMVIARFASHPAAANANNDWVSLPAFHALAQRLCD